MMKIVRNLCTHCLSCFRQTALTKVPSGWQSLIPVFFFFQPRFSRSYVLQELHNPHNFLCAQMEICIMTFQGYVFLCALSLKILDYWDSPVGQLGCLPSWGLVPICARLLSHVCPELLFPVLVIWYLSPGSQGPNSPFFNSLCPILRSCPTIVLFIRIGTLVWLPSQILGNFRNILISSLLSRLGENMLLSTPHSPSKHNTYN